MKNRLAFALRSTFALLLITGVCSTARAAEPSPEARQEATARFRRGVTFYDSGDYTAALAEFKAAYRTAPNPKVLFNIGLTERRLFRYRDAVRSLRRYLDEVGADVPPERRAAVERELAEIRALTAEVTVEVPGDPAQLTVDGEDVGTTPLGEPLLLRPGSHRLRATRGDQLPAEKAVDVVSGTRLSVTLDPRPRPKVPTTARLELSSKPPGAGIVIDAHPVCATPCSATVEAGGHEVAARLTGYRDVRLEVMLTAGQVRPLELSLNRLPVVLPWYRRWYVWTLAAAVVAGGVTTAVVLTRPTWDVVINR